MVLPNALESGKSLVACVAVSLAIAACSSSDNLMQMADDTQTPDSEIPEVEAIDGGLERGDPATLSAIVDLVANDYRMDTDGEYIGAYKWRHSRSIDGGETLYSYLYPGWGAEGASDVEPYIAVWHDEEEKLQLDVDLYRYGGVGRVAETWVDPENLRGVSRFRHEVTDHGLGSQWRMDEVTNDYVDGGTLDIRLVTDLQPSDMATSPFPALELYSDGIEFDDAPPLQPGQDYREFELQAGGSVSGSLNGVEGSFSCTEGTCYFYDYNATDGFFSTWSNPIVRFTPAAGGPTQDVQPNPPYDAESLVDYLAFGSWLYVPEDVADAGAYDFGVFTHGGEPFDVSNVAGLTGTANYVGGATGHYYVGKDSDNPAVGTFVARVALTADFGTDSETGFVNGTVSSFTFDGDVASQFPMTMVLTSDTYSSTYRRFGVDRGTTNIFDTVRTGSSGSESGPFPGGWVEGRYDPSGTEAEGTEWHVLWDAAFFGNGTAATDHPTSIAGTFSAFDQPEATKGLAGAFGAHKEE